MKKLTYDEIQRIVLSKFNREREARRDREQSWILGSDYKGEENGIPYNPDLVDFTCLMEIGF